MLVHQLRDIFCGFNERLSYQQRSFLSSAPPGCRLLNVLTHCELLNAWWVARVGGFEFRTLLLFLTLGS